MNWQKSSLLKDTASYEFRIAALSNGGKERIIQDFSNNVEFELPLDGRGILKIVWRNLADNTDIHTVEMEYE